MTSQSVGGVEVVLPGGLHKNGRIERRARFYPISGRIEQSLIEVRFGADRAGYVTAILSSALESVGRYSADPELVADLCVADRQFLMLRLAALFNGEQVWLKVGCGHCESQFDVDIRRCDLPVKEAGPGFPTVELRINERTIVARVSTGADQQLLVDQAEDNSVLHLLQRCVLSVNGEPPNAETIHSFSASEIEAIDAALDEMSPAVCEQLLVTCPECKKDQHAELDHYDLAGLNERHFYSEVHTLASHYHWSEAAILDLPKARRHLYLKLIDHSAGMTTGGIT